MNVTQHHPREWTETAPTSFQPLLDAYTYEQHLEQVGEIERQVRVRVRDSV